MGHNPQEAPEAFTCKNCGIENYVHAPKNGDTWETHTERSSPCREDTYMLKTNVPAATATAEAAEGWREVSVAALRDRRNTILKAVGAQIDRLNGPSQSNMRNESTLGQFLKHCPEVSVLLEYLDELAQNSSSDTSFGATR